MKSRRTSEFTVLSPAAVLMLLMASTSPRVLAQDGQQGPPPTPVRVGTVEQRELQDQRRVTGELRAVSRSNVATIEEGLVVRLPIEEGQIVSAGDVLAVLDSRRLNLELARLEGQRRAAEAIVDARAAELDQDERDRDALKRLSQERASNPKELADAESQVVIAQARLEEARRDLEVLTAQVDLVQTKIDDTTITAPFAGVVVSKKTEVGQWLGTGGIVAEVVANEAYDAWLDVPQEFAEYLLSRDAEVQLRIDATGETFRASDLRIVPLVDPMARTFNVYIRLVNDERRLAAGMSLTGWVPTGERQEYLTVPSDALLRNDAGFFVYVARVQPEGPAIAAPAQVDVLFETDGHVAVRGGSLRGGDRVVTEGNERLFPMTPISFELVDTPQSAADPGA